MSEKKICLLCKQNEVYQIKSHLTPAVITENTFGPRNAEEIITIDPKKKEVDTYYGPQHKQTGSTAVKIAPNVRKGIFCKTCEANFGVYEDAVQPKLNDLVNSLGKGIAINKSKEGGKYITIDIHPNILITFFQGVVWRQCIEQQLDGMSNPLPEDELEKLRLLILENSSTTLSEIIKKDLSGNPKMSIFTTYHTSDPDTASFSNPNTANTNPRIFFIGPIVLLYWLPGNQTADFYKVTGIDDNLLNDEVSLANSILSIVNEGAWAKIYAPFAKVVARQFNSR